ncbi:MAG: divergent PAP2 family protein [Firmicutes bacterium]|nr:divergent PAP2 family protein [Bacillota bacterium]MCL5014797.1 divergent PAP2 family protein [Bacillota bacterium]
MQWLLHSNRVLISAVVAAVTAQVLKFVIYFLSRHEPRFDRLVGAGGMPSSHSAMVVALVSSIGYQYGWRSGQFAISAVFGMIVLYDAIHVRRVVGLQSRYLNLVSRSEYVAGIEHDFPEFVGHTPWEVVVGMIWGLIISRLFY